MTRHDKSCTHSAYTCCACVPQPVRFRDEQKAVPQEQQQQPSQSQQSVERKVEKQVAHTTKQGERVCVCVFPGKASTQAHHKAGWLCSFHMSARSM